MWCSSDALLDGSWRARRHHLPASTRGDVCAARGRIGRGPAEPSTTKRPSSVEVLGGVGEAAHLVACVSSANSVLKAMKISRYSPSTADVGEVAHRHRDRVAARFRSQLLDHSLGGIDAVTPGHSPRGAAPPAGADRELEHGAPAARSASGVDRTLGAERALVERVVGLGDPIAVRCRRRTPSMRLRLSRARSASRILARRPRRWARSANSGGIGAPGSSRSSSSRYASIRAMSSPVPTGPWPGITVSASSPSRRGRICLQLFTSPSPTQQWLSITTRSAASRVATSGIQKDASLWRDRPRT